jgi:hypothetical protein
MRNAFGKLRRHITRTFHHFLDIKGNALHGKTELRRIMQQMINLGTAQQSLRRNTAPVQANTPQMLFLDQRRIHTQLRRTDRRDIATRPAANHHNIKIPRFGHVLYS